MTKQIVIVIIVLESGRRRKVRRKMGSKVIENGNFYNTKDGDDDNKYDGIRN